MGIRGLTSFIDRNPHVLHSFELKDCSVVIDGNNFYHYLYYACHVNCSLGGDYDVYRKKIISTFKSLEKCGVRPYVILDGAYPVDDRKLKTSLMRATVRTTLVGVMGRFGRGQVLPILAYDTFMQVLTELGVRHVTCQFEADREIAVLANKLKCPVISNDSDFYIFDLVGGFLPLDYVDFRPLCKSEISSDSEDATWYLHSQMYCIDDFISAFKGLSRQVLPVFACLLGNDFIKASAFDSFYSRLQVPKVYSKKFQLPPRLSKIISVLHWFHIHHKDWSTLLQEVLQFLKPQNQSKLRQLFLTSLDVYSNIDKFEGCDLYAYFDKEQTDFKPIAGPGFTGFNGASFPSWFLMAVCNGDICPSTMNAAVLHRVIFLSQVENLSNVTSYHCSRGIRRVLYGILFKSDLLMKSELCGENAAFNTDECFSDSSKQTASTLVTADVEGPGRTLKDPIEDDEATEKTEEEEDGDDKEAEKGEEKIGDEGTEKEEEGVDGDEETEKAEEELEKAVACLMSKESQSKSVRKQTQMEEYHRVKRNIQRLFTDPMHSLNGIPLPTLSCLQDMPVENRQKVLLSALDVSSTFLGCFSDDIRLYSSCLSTWLKNAEPKVSERHLDSVILCLIYLSIRDKLSCKLYKNKRMDEDKSSVNSGKPFRIDLLQTWKSVHGDQLQTVHQNLSKYHKSAPTFHRKNHMQPSIVHAFAQLQACILDASNLNKLLSFPIANLRPASLLNGTFLYNVFEDIISRSKPDMFLGSLLLPDSLVHKLFLEFKSVLLEFLPEDLFEDSPLTLKHPRKSRKRRTKEKSSIKSQQEDGVKSSESEEEKEFTVISGFDISNKFSSLLSLDG